MTPSKPKLKPIKLATVSTVGDIVNVTSDLLQKLFKPEEVEYIKVRVDYKLYNSKEYSNQIMSVEMPKKARIGGQRRK